MGRTEVKISQSTETAKRAAIYREAARLIENDKMDYSCCAIAEAQGIFDEWNRSKAESALVDGYADVMGSFKEAGGFCCGWTDDGRDERVVALCFMAAMVEAGDA
jgi:hypothetical protein